MTTGMVRWAVAVALTSASVAPAVFAEESQRTLPTLLIKGEVVSVDTNDPSAVLLKVKDRYGFETPIYLTQETEIAQGDQALTASNLTPGTSVEVEYNFDINTAKRHAVKVDVSAPPATASSPASAAPASSPAPAAAPAAPPAAAPAAAAPASESAPAQPAPASTTQEHPGKEHPGSTTQ